MINLYIIVSIVFLVAGILDLLNNVNSLRTTRSRETKVWNRHQIVRCKTMIALSIVWPVSVIIIARELVSNRELIFVKEDEQKERN